MSQTAKVFWSGRSQAVRLPKAYRFDGDQVHIHRREDGAVVLEPVRADGVVLPVAEAAAAALDRLRAAIAEGLDSGDSAPWSIDEVKRLARAR